MKILRLYSNKDGDSVFEEIELSLKNMGIIGSMSEPVEVDRLIFRETPADYDYDFHCAPEKQYIVFLDGKTEITTSLGDKRVFTSGDILLVEDTTGKGHKTKHLINKKRRSLFIPIKEI